MSGLDCLVLLSIIRRQICNSPSPSHSNEDVSGVRTRAANDPSVFTITENALELTSTALDFVLEFDQFQ